MSIGAGVAAQAHDIVQAPIVNGTRLPAPNKGIDTRAALGRMAEENCIYAFNLVPTEQGMRVRDGFREWQIDVEDIGTPFGVHTLIVFDGTVTTPSDNRLFAVTNEGIFNVTDEGATPILEIAFTADTTKDAGYGVYAHYIEKDGDEFLYYADSKNGLFEYDATLDTWTQATGITGPNLLVIDFVVVHKQRMWLVEQDSNIGWYLPIASANGAATEFFFGPKFPHGGKLKALINWSVDGGIGLDDYLIAISSSGDVVPYQGSDPSTIEAPGTTGGWAVRGTYFIGKIPEGKRFFSEYSGELYMLSSFGLIAMGDLLRGVDPTDIAAVSLTFPIASVIRRELLDNSEAFGWEPVFVPSQGTLLIQAPRNPRTGRHIQYAMNLALQGWGIWRDVPMTAFVEWDNRMYFGTLDSRVMVMDVPRDNILLDTGNPNAGGTPIEFSLLSSYSDLNSPGKYKIGQYVRGDFLAGVSVNYNTKIIYDFVVAEQILALVPSATDPVATWDISLWDAGIWGSGELIAQSRLQGAGGHGRTMAVAMRGQAVDFTRFLGFDVLWTEGFYT